MENDERIVRYTAAELDAMLARGEDETDWARVDAMTDEEIEASIDWEEEGIPDEDSARGYTIWNEQRITMYLDEPTIAWFRAAVAGTGIGYKTRIGEVLRDYVAGQSAAPPEPAPELTPAPMAIAPATPVPGAAANAARPRRRTG